MIVQELLSHQWRKALRAPGFYKNLIVNILLGFGALYFLSVFIIVGLFLPEMIQESGLPYKPLEAVLGAFLYYVVMDIAIRFFMQPLNTLQITPYQVLPVKRSTLVNYLLWKPILNPVNYALLLILFPFGLRMLFSGEISFGLFAGLILTAVFTIWFTIFCALYLKRKFSGNMVGIIVIFSLIGVVVALEYFQIFSLFRLSLSLFGFLVHTPFAFLILLMVALVGLGFNKLFFAKNYYPEKFSKKTEYSSVVGSDLSFLNRFGVFGDIISLQIKLILRHKRTKSIMYLSFAFLFYGLLFYTSDTYNDNHGMLFFVAMFVTGIFMLMYGQWIISWDGTHFDCLMTQKMDAKTYLKANYFLLISLNIISFILTTPYFLFGQDIAYLHIAAFLYNTGVNTIFFLITASFNTKRLDLSKSSAMNYQGTTYKNFLFVLPMFFFPLIFIAILSAFGSWKIGVIILGGIGVLGIILHNSLSDITTRIFLKRKYKLCDGFRKKES